MSHESKDILTSGLDVEGDVECDGISVFTQSNPVKSPSKSAKRKSGSSKSGGSKKRKAKSAVKSSGKWLNMLIRLVWQKLIQFFCNF